MKPYYSHAGIEIYHGDCREVLPTLQASLVLTDPPYQFESSEVIEELEPVAAPAVIWI